MSKEYPVIDSLESLEEEIARVKKAQAVYATYTQEQVDRIFLAAATAANKARIPLARAAHEETGMGIVEDKVIKNHFASEYIYNAYRDTKTCGVIEEDKAYGMKKIAEPLGLVCAIIPTTNPTSTAIFKPSRPATASSSPPTTARRAAPWRPRRSFSRPLSPPVRPRTSSAGSAPPPAR